MRPPAFIDNGAPGTWLEALLHSPCLKVTDYQPDQLSEADGSQKAPFPLLGGAPGRGLDADNGANAAPGSGNISFHDTPNSPEAQRNHG